MFSSTRYDLLTYDSYFVQLRYLFGLCPKVPGTFLWSESVRHKKTVVVREVPGTLLFRLNSYQLRSHKPDFLLEES